MKVSVLPRLLFVFKLTEGLLDDAETMKMAGILVCQHKTVCIIEIIQYLNIIFVYHATD